MKKILAIGGAVIKTARKELIKVIEDGKVEMLIHNGGSIFHDLQLASEQLYSHSYPLDMLIEDFECNRDASELVWDWIHGLDAPTKSITRLCRTLNIPVLMFTGMACDYWHFFGTIDDWSVLGRYFHVAFETLSTRFKKPFHYVCMGSAVIHPEVFIKALSVNKPDNFVADVVDFKDMYRPKTRVAKYGTYYKMTHKEFLNKEEWPSLA